jgi:hypothetical protein
LGNVYTALENYPEALAAYQHYLELAGDSADPYVVDTIADIKAILEEGTAQESG